MAKKAKRGPSKEPGPKAAKPAKADQREEQVAEAQKRARACYDEIVGVLRHHRCAIVASVTEEPVGSGPGMKVLIGATWAVAPGE